MKRNADLITVNKVIAEFCADVVGEPLCFFSEADLQSLLYARLVNVFPRPLETAVPRGPGAVGRYRTGRVHREYGAGSGRRIDLCVFSRAAIESIDSPALTARGAYLRPEFAIELGTEKTVDATAHIGNDLQKLQLAGTQAYLIHFSRDPAVADTGTKRRDATEGRITQDFRQPALATPVIANVVCLFFVLRIRRTASRIWGKCEFCGSGDSAWSKVNASRVAHTVLNVLERAQTRAAIVGRPPTEPTASQ